MKDQPSTTRYSRTPGSHDGDGAGDRDQPFFGFREYQFNTRQLARLLQLRGKVLEARLGQGVWAQDVSAAS
jgi:hypothetical protein